MDVTGISNGRLLRINFDVHSSEPLGMISISERASQENILLYGKLQTKVISSYFDIEQLRKMRREVSRILFEVERRTRKKQ